MWVRLPPRPPFTTDDGAPAVVENAVPMSSSRENGPVPPYDHKAIEAKWQQKWAEEKAFAAPDLPDPAKKYYVLEMFPYPSGNLHMGHVRNYAIGDLIARFERSRG